ncbi:MAG: hypothetical protein ACR2PA_11720 [Hyphomicrobiaceae bacterium]
MRTYVLTLMTMIIGLVSSGFAQATQTKTKWDWTSTAVVCDSITSCDEKKAKKKTSSEAAKKGHHVWKSRHKKKHTRKKDTLRKNTGDTTGIMPRKPINGIANMRTASIIASISIAIEKWRKPRKCICECTVRNGAASIASAMVTSAGRTSMPSARI